MPCANGQSEGKCGIGTDACERVRTTLGPAAHDAAPADTDKEKTAANAPKRSLSGCLEWPEKRTSRLAVLKSGWQRRMTARAWYILSCILRSPSNQSLSSSS